MSVSEVLSKYGFVGTVRQCARVGALIATTRFHRWKTRHAPRYRSPTEDELAQIERDLRDHGIMVTDYNLSPSVFLEFKSANYFPSNYHGGPDGGVWDEKLLEHCISSELLGLNTFGADDVYVDIAASSSPWVKVLRERKGMQAFAIDLQVSPEFRSLPFYRAENATATTFGARSVRAASLHCAYEMFMRDDDMNLIPELARILRPGGKAVIVPLYMHTHYCAYSSPESYGKGYSDPDAKEYVRTDVLGIQSSRKYDAPMLKRRVLDRIEAAGMRYRLLVLRNKAALGHGIYCHFILEIEQGS